MRTVLDCPWPWRSTSLVFRGSFHGTKSFVATVEVKDAVTLDVDAHLVESSKSTALTTYEGNDGAPAGDYQVTVELWLAKGDEGPVNRLPFKFSRPESSALTAKVNPEPTKLNPLEVRY